MKMSWYFEKKKILANLLTPNNITNENGNIIADVIETKKITVYHYDS